MNRPAVINVIATAAEKASRRLLRDFGEVEQLQVSRKGPSDFVSMADKRAEKTIFHELSKARPDWGFLLEESGSFDPAEGTNARWIVDPLDGTTNFLHGLPHFAISIAAEIHGKIEAGIIYDPVRDEMFWAEKGSGAWVNNKRLRVSGRSDLRDSLLATGFPWHGKPGQELATAEINAFMPRVAGIRRFGSAALDLAYVAAGRYDAFWEHGLHIWDIAAGVIIVREAGGYVSDTDGGDDMLKSGSIIASNNNLQGDMEKTLRDVNREIKNNKDKE